MHPGAFGRLSVRGDSQDRKADPVVDSVPAQKTLHIESIECQGMTWVDIKQPTQAETDYLKEKYGFPDLDLDDCLRRVHRPKIDEREDYLFMMFHFPVFERRAQVIRPSQVSLFLGKGYLVTLHEGNLEPLVRLFDDCRRDENTRIEYMARGPAHLLYHILDRLVIYCFSILNKIGDSLQAIEEQVFGVAGRETVRDISTLRRNIISFRRLIKSQTEVFELLEQREWPIIKGETEVYFGDIAGHSRKMRDEIDDYKEVIEGLSDTHSTVTTSQTNKVVKALTIISTIMLPLTLIASVFGMHLEHLPLSQSPVAFLIVILVMVVIVILMLALFRIRRWL